MQIYHFFQIAVALATLDQFTKYLVVTYIPLYADVNLIPGFLGLTYVRNFGAAFSSLQGMLGLFFLIFLLFTLAMIWALKQPGLPLTRLEWVCLAFVYGGGLGNMIDRLHLGYVVDMIETKFMDFPVFNVADCFITCGCIALLVHLTFFNKQFWKEEKK